MRHSQINKARLFTARDDVDRVTECILGLREKSAGVTRYPQRVGANCPDPLRWNFAQTLAEPLQTLDGTFTRVRGESMVLVQATCKTDHLLNAVDDVQLTVYNSGNFQVKTVGAEVNRGNHIGEIVLHGR
jgi:hypothetical protein